MKTMDLRESSNKKPANFRTLLVLIKFSCCCIAVFQCRADEDTGVSKIVTYRNNFITAIGTSVGESTSKIDIAKSGREQSEIVLDAVVGPIESIRAVGVGLLLVQMKDTESIATEVAVIDVDRMAVRQRFLCFYPTLSPNHRYLAFGAFHAVRGADSEILYSSKELVYDFEKDNGANFDPRRLADPSSRSQPGWLIYPQTWSPQTDPRDERFLFEYDFPGPFFWSADSKKLLFMETHFDVLDPLGPGSGSHKTEAPAPKPAYVGLVMLNVSSGSLSVSEALLGRCVDDNVDCMGELVEATFFESSVKVSIKHPNSSSLDSRERMMFYNDFRKITK